MISLFIFLSFLFTYNQQEIALQLNTSDVYGPYVQHPNGTALYMFQLDTYNKSVCYANCAKVWPPYLYDKSKSYKVGEGLNVSLLNYSVRTDNTLIFTYNGWPLYFYAGEISISGSTKCQGIKESEGFWWLLSPNGNPNLLKKGRKPSKTSNNTLEIATSSKYGIHLTDNNNVVLYTFSLDYQTFDKSNCYGDCAKEWPPYLISDEADLTTSTNVRNSSIGTHIRNDSKIQVTYNGYPLYYYFDETTNGTTKCQGINNSGGIWNLVKPDGTIIEGIISDDSSTKRIKFILVIILAVISLFFF